MLTGLRKAGNSFIGRIVATVLFGILILSFAIWGIGDIFRGAPSNRVATVGQTEISAERFRTAYNSEIQRLNQQFRANITPEQARAFGLDQQVLARLISEAVLAERARDLGLSASDQLVARKIVEEPALRGPNGQFDRARFEQVLRDNGLTEGGFISDQRAALVRLHLVDALTAALPVPTAAKEAMNRFANERRDATYILLTPAAAGEIATPTDEQLQAFYEERKSSFNAPEYRTLNVVALGPESLAKPEAVADADARERYEQTKSRFGSPERRTVQQMTFASAEEAETAFNRIREGAAFEAIATERNLGPQDLVLGSFTKSEMLDSAVADAAFSLEQGAVSGPVQGRFGPVLLRVTEIQPEAVRPFEEVSAEVRRDLALERARAEIDNVHDAIEDMRASARPLAEIAQEKGLTLVQVPAVDRTGQDKGGQAVASLPEQDALLRAAFASDIGVDNEALRTRDGGYVWFDVTGIEPPRERPLDEVREEVARQWRAAEVTQRLSQKAGQLVERLDKGESIETVAAEVNASVKTATDLARRTAKDDLTADAVTRIFTTPVSKAATAPNGEENRAVFKVNAARVPPLVTTTQEAQQIENQLREGMSDDIVSQYIGQVQKDLGVTINQQVVRQVVGGEV
jgi:peptidyl-prolyl cis-trans isomerase D